MIDAAEHNDTLRIIVVRNPGKSVPGKIVFPQRRVLPVKPVEGTDEMLQHPVGFVVQQQPVQAAFKIPFLELAEFTAHKKQLFPRMCHHIPQERPHHKYSKNPPITRTKNVASFQYDRNPNLI